MQTEQEKQGYRVKTAQPVCGNCSKCSVVYAGCLTDESAWCTVGEFEADKNLGTCQHHEWRK